jgi:pimeloyl-ACP methyl ester carboxylesterase
MEFITTTNNDAREQVKVAYSDYGIGDPVILIHGWPLSREMWEYQLGDLVDAGFRVIKYDRRGFGKSSKPWDGYDYDSLASDLNAIIEQLDLHKVTLVGFSMGGGEVARYLSKFGAKRISRVVLVSTVLPYLLKTSDNPDGVDPHVFEEIMQQVKNDRIGFLDEFGKTFFGVNMVSHPVSKPLLEYYRMLASFASARSTLQCAISFAKTDFRQDIAAITVPMLIIHGDADKIVPIEASSDRTATMIPGAQYLIYEGAPHGLFYEYRKHLNQDLINFIKGGTNAYSTTLNAAINS